MLLVVGVALLVVVVVVAVPLVVTVELDVVVVMTDDPWDELLIEIFGAVASTVLELGMATLVVVKPRLFKSLNARDA